MSAFPPWLHGEPKCWDDPLSRSAGLDTTLKPYKLCRAYLCAAHAYPHVCRAAW